MAPNAEKKEDAPAKKRNIPLPVKIIFALVLLLAAKAAVDKWLQDGRQQGYIEGELTYLSAAVPGRLQKLNVQRGDKVKAGQTVFELEHTPQSAALEETQGKLAQAKAALVLSSKDFDRQAMMLKQNVDTQQAYDRATSSRDQAQETVTRMQAALQNAQWELDETIQRTAKDGIVFDTMYREGEWVSASAPVVALLTPEGIRARTYVDETRLAQLAYGDPVTIRIGETTLQGKVVYISPKAEYTPPVIYSQESRSKFVWRVDIGFTTATAATLHPGQPVDVIFAREK